LPYATHHTGNESSDDGEARMMVYFVLEMKSCFFIQNKTKDFNARPDYEPALTHQKHKIAAAQQKAMAEDSTDKSHFVSEF
jgi:hypothetical protein